MAEVLTMTGTMLVIYGMIALIVHAAENRRPGARVRHAVLDEARRQRLETAVREHERARDYLAQNTAERRN
jgi:hypothetical protein